MSLARNKKGLELSTLIEIFLVILATGLIIGVFTVASGRAEEKTSENLCRGFNALRFGTQVETPVGNFNIVPRACKTIDKGDLPGKDYKDYSGGLKEGAKAETRDLMARCWWMWLEGNKPNMFDQSSTAIFSKNKCFICYTFSLSKNAEFTMEEFATSLNAPYYAVDSTDRCAPAGQGGKCMPACDKSSNYFSREVASNKCKPDERCCIAADSQDECKNKGGRCLSGPSDEYTEIYTKWQCKSGSCYIKKDKLASYLDYLQGTKGISDGSGFVAYQNELTELKSGKKYGIILISPGNSPSWDTAGLGTLTLVGGALTAAGTYYTPLFKGKVLAIGSTATYALYRLTANSGNPNINYIYISDYDSIKNKCAIEAGVGEK